MIHSAQNSKVPIFCFPQESKGSPECSKVPVLLLGVLLQAERRGATERRPEARRRSGLDRLPAPGGRSGSPRPGRLAHQTVRLAAQQCEYLALQYDGTKAGEDSLL